MRGPDYTLDLDRLRRVGFPEVVLAEGVTPHHLLATLLNHDVNLRLFEVVVPTLHQIFVQRVGAEAAVAARHDEEMVVA